MSPDDEVTYQWYTFNNTVVDDYAAVPMTKEKLVEMEGPVPDFVIFHQDESVFNPENGKWSPVYYSINDTEPSEVYYTILPFYMTVEAGDEYIVVTEGIDSPYFSGIGIYNYDEVYSEQIDENTFAISFDTAGTYMFFVENQTAPEDPYIFVSKVMVSDVMLEGETSATLSCDMEANVYYYCVATYSDETILVSDLVSKSYYVTKQPTSADPSVEVSSPDEVEGYQWYTFEKSENVTITDKNASTYSIADFLSELIGMIPPGFSIPSIKSESSYDSEKDLWIPFVFNPVSGSGTVEQLIMSHFAIELAEGDRITITAEDLSLFTEFEVGNISAQTALEFVENDDGSRTYVADATGRYMVVAMVTFETEVEESSIDPEDYAISAYGSVDSPVMIKGETKATLSEMSYGEKYFCEITYIDGTVIDSKTFKAEPSIIKQPTATSPNVGVTFPEAVVSYEWYNIVTYDYGSVTPAMVGSYTTENSDEIFGLTSDVVIYNDATSYDPETQIWTPVNYTYVDGSYDYAEFFVIYMEEGESLDLEIVNDVDEGIITDIYLYSVDFGDGFDAVQNDDGTYTITVEQAGEYLLCYDVYYDVIPEGFGAKVYKNNVFDSQLIEGQTGNTLTEKVVDEAYMCVVTYKDGTVLESDMFTVSEDEMWTLGDVNGDGVIDKKDYVTVKRYCFGSIKLDETQLLSADVNGDGEVDKKDYGLLKRHCFGTYVIG